MECSQIFHDYFTIYRIRVFWNVRQIKFMQTIFMFSVIALYIVHRRVVINMVVGVYYIVIIKFIDFATKQFCCYCYNITRTRDVHIVIHGRAMTHAQKEP